jgi:hypothetical protein
MIRMSHGSGVAAISAQHDLDFRFSTAVAAAMENRNSGSSGRAALTSIPRSERLVAVRERPDRLIRFHLTEGSARTRRPAG